MLFFTVIVAVSILRMNTSHRLKVWVLGFLTVKRALLLITLPSNHFILFWRRKRSIWNTILLSMKLKSVSLIIFMDFITVIVFTRLLTFCRRFNLKYLYFTLNSFRFFVSNLLTWVHSEGRHHSPNTTYHE